MTSVLDRIPRGSRAGIVRLRSLGDCVLSTPAIRLLKQARPDLEIGVVVEPRFQAVFEGNPDVAAILPPSALAFRRFGPELCLNLHGGGTSARITALSGARHRAGLLCKVTGCEGFPHGSHLCSLMCAQLAWIAGSSSAKECWIQL